MGLCLSMLSPFFKWFSTMGYVPLLDYLVRLYRFFRISGIYHDMFFSRCLDLCRLHDEAGRMGGAMEDALLGDEHILCCAAFREHPAVQIATEAREVADADLQP